MRILTILRKEWAEVFKNRLVSLSIVLTPVLFVAMSVFTLFTMRNLPEEADAEQAQKDLEEIRAFAGEMCADLGAADCMQAYMSAMYLLMFLLLPVILPSVFASYSVVGEKTSKTLEPLLATPIATWELLAGKAIAAVLPGIASTWAGVLLFYASSAFLISPAALWTLLTPAWIAAIGVLGPLLAIFSVLAAMMISSRVDDPRYAQQISGLFVLPMVGLLVAQTFGLFMVDGAVVWAGVGILVAVDAVLLWLAVQVFDREAILTRWK